MILAANRPLLLSGNKTIHSRTCYEKKYFFYFSNDVCAGAAIVAGAGFSDH
jgi:hypothetical protein